MRSILAYSSLLGLLFTQSTVGYVIDEKCYAGPGKGAVNVGTNMYQSQGNCQQTCLKMNKAVFALTQGNACYCSDEKPDKKVDDDKCNIACFGYPQNCGGAKAYKVGFSGLDGQDSAFVPSDPSSSSSESSSSEEGASTTTVAGVTSYVTTTEKPSAAKEGTTKSSGNTAGVAAGVVVGVIGAIAIGVGAFLTIRRRRRLQAEEEYRQAVATKEFVSSIRKPTGDARLDPVILNQRRLSDGSIADNQDYSRRILKVTNPDA